MLIKPLKWALKLFFVGLAVYGLGQIPYRGKRLYIHVEQQLSQQWEKTKLTARKYIEKEKVNQLRILGSSKKNLTARPTPSKDTITISEEKRIEKIIEKAQK